MTLLPKNLSTKDIVGPVKVSGTFSAVTMQMTLSDFSRTAANIAGLVSLLETGVEADPDFNNIRNYLLIESAKLLAMARAVCIEAE